MLKNNNTENKMPPNKNKNLAKQHCFFNYIYESN